jgi:hypothetical protein
MSFDLSAPAATSRRTIPARLVVRSFALGPLGCAPASAFISVAVERPPS